MNEEFNETTDLYLQLLRKAQEIEDPRLVGMILERLKNEQPCLLGAKSTCVVIPFPASTMKPDLLVDEYRFWPRLTSAQVGLIAALYMLLIAGHSFFS